MIVLPALSIEHKYLARMPVLNLRIVGEGAFGCDAPNIALANSTAVLPGLFSIKNFSTSATIIWRSYLRDANFIGEPFV